MAQKRNYYQLELALNNYPDPTVLLGRKFKHRHEAAKQLNELISTAHANGFNHLTYMIHEHVICGNKHGRPRRQSRCNAKHLPALRETRMVPRGPDR